MQKDLQRYCNFKITVGKKPSLALKIRLLLSTTGLQAILIYRFGRYVYAKRTGVFKIIFNLLFPVYKALYWISRKGLGIDIDINANIGEGFYIGHFGGISIGECTIGSNSSIAQHVKILSEDGKNPQVGDNVWIGAHSIIKPGIIIGDSATISAGSYVDNDVKSRSLVMGNPARVIIKDYENSKLL